MSEILFHYHRIHPATWVYVSSLMMIALYFKFGRFWSVRNLDLVLLILLAPGLLLVDFGEKSRELTRSLLTEYETEAAQAERAGVESTLSDNPAAGEPRSPETPTGASAAGAPETAKAELPDDVRESLDELTGSLADRNRNECRRLVKEIQAAYGDDPAVARALLGKLTAYGERGRRVELLGYLLLFSAGGMVLVRLLLDPIMVRRPLLEPNLSVGGLTFVGCALFVFLMANVITSTPTAAELKGPEGAKQLLQRREAPSDDGRLAQHGPGYPLFFTLFSGVEPSVASRSMAFLSHLAVLIGMVVIGYRHFDNIRMGMGAATLYLMLPYTAQMTGRVDHVLPAALLVWAIVTYRRPLLAGVFVGLAAGVVYYPLFLLPLWISFYWQRGLYRFLAGVLAMLAVVAGSLLFTSSDAAAFWAQFQQMFGLWLPVREGLEGIWRIAWDPIYRIPVLAAFAVLSFSFALWPPQKNLGTLISCTAAVMLAVQFWHGYGGGTLLAWYLPLLLLTIFRPNLEDRVAPTAVAEAWLSGRRRRALAT